MASPLRVHATPVPPVAPNPSATVSFIAKTPNEWFPSFARAMEDLMSTTSDTRDFYQYEYNFLTESQGAMTGKYQEEMDKKLYDAVYGLLGPPSGQIPSFYLWKAFVKSYENYVMRPGMNAIILDVLNANGYIQTPTWAEDQEWVAKSVMGAVQHRAFQHCDDKLTERVKGYLAKQNVTAKFDLMKPGTSLVAHRQPAAADPVYYGFYNFLSVRRPSRGKTQVELVWYKTIAEHFSSAMMVVDLIRRNHEEMADLAPLFRDEERNDAVNYLDGAIRLTLLDMVFGPPKLEVPVGVLDFLEQERYGHAALLRTYLVYRHHVKLPAKERVDPPSASNLPLLMGTTPVAA